MAATRADIETYKLLRQRGDIEAALSHLAGLVDKHPKDRSLLAVTAPLALQLGRAELAQRCYLGLLALPDIPAADLFTVGYALKALGCYDDAISAYQQALDKGLDKPQNAYLNMGVIFADEMHAPLEAETLFKRAIEHEPALLAPYINLGNLYEETGAFAKAEALYTAAVDAVPNGYEAIARLANAHNFTDPNDPLLAKLETAAAAPEATAFDKECLHFALGTAYNSLKDYKTAWQHYEQANICGLSFGRPYVPAEMQAFCDDIIAAFTPELFQSKQPEAGKPPCPVFICGMFRSGSTLTEQVLAAHPEFTPLGECDFIPRLAQSAPDYYPRRAAAIKGASRTQLARRYMAQNAAAEVTTQYFTDKRPDNVLYLGLIKHIFPHAKIVHTVREPIDNYLSIYFTQFGDGQAYARKWADIAHYHEQQKRLMEHWRTLFGDDIYEMKYDDFVADPERQTKKLLQAIGAPWDPATMNFHTKKNRVKTASYKQIRQPLYSSSSGRWKNYAPWLPRA